MVVLHGWSRLKSRMVDTEAFLCMALVVSSDNKMRTFQTYILLEKIWWKYTYRESLGHGPLEYFSQSSVGRWTAQILAKRHYFGVQQTVLEKYIYKQMNHVFSISL